MHRSRSESDWRLSKLLKGAHSFFQEVGSHKETKPARFQKGTKNAGWILGDPSALHGTWLAKS